MGTILLVEDNKVNQLVGSKVLESLGYGFSIANNGVEAVRGFQEGGYDAMLMDCQMPEMDGYEATAEIRRLEGGVGHIPIIAMTAAAMEGDREKCMAAGMDDFITKPVRMEAVSTVLERWVTSRWTSTERASGVVVVSETMSGLMSRCSIASRSTCCLSLDDGEGAVLDRDRRRVLRESDELRAQLLAAVGRQ